MNKVIIGLLLQLEAYVAQLLVIPMSQLSQQMESVCYVHKSVIQQEFKEPQSVVVKVDING